MEDDFGLILHGFTKKKEIEMVLEGERSWIWYMYSLICNECDSFVTPSINFVMKLYSFHFGYCFFWSLKAYECIGIYSYFVTKAKGSWAKCDRIGLGLMGLNKMRAFYEIKSTLSHVFYRWDKKSRQHMLDFESNEC